MNVEKIVRVLGYVVYTALWSPVIVLAIVITPIMSIALTIRNGGTLKSCIRDLKNGFMNGLKHDMKFIQTGEW